MENNVNIEKNVSSLSTMQKFWCIVGAISNIILGYSLYWVFKDDNDIRHQEFAKCMLLGARLGLFIIPIGAAVIGFITAFLGI